MFPLTIIIHRQLRLSTRGWSISIVQSLSQILGMQQWFIGLCSQFIIVRKIIFRVCVVIQIRLIITNHA